MKRTYLTLVLLLGAVLAGWKIYDNKRVRDAETDLARVTRAFVPVEVVEPQLESLAGRLEADGLFLPAREMFIISETAGRVIEVYKNKGDRLREGDLIAKVDDELLSIELAATQANLAKLYKDKERLVNLIGGDAAPKNKIEDLELGILAAESKEKGLKKQISNTFLRAPMKGILGMRFIERGSVIGPGIQIGQITDLDQLFLTVKVTERDVLNIQKGKAVRVVPDVYPDMEIPGTVTNIGLRADNAFTYDVEISFRNSEKKPLRGGMHGRAVFMFNTDRKGLTLPRKAVAGSIQEPRIYVINADSTASLRPIKLGAVFGEKVEVVSGVQSGEKVVLGGQINLSDGARVSIVKER